MTPTPEQEAAVGIEVCKRLDAPRPWNVTVLRRRDGNLHVSFDTSRGEGSPDTYLVTRDGMVTETTYLD